MLELALVRWALEKLRDHGFEPVIPPVLVREQALYGTGFLPDTEQQIYRLPEDELYLVGTSEVALASLHADEILDAERLPLRYAGFSPCFRREAGAAGKDTRGIFRVHQFDKVEMFSFVAPERLRRGARADPRDRGGDPQRAGAPLPRRQHRRRRPRQLGRQEVRLRGLAAQPGALPRADVVLEHDRLPGAAPGHPRCARDASAPRRRTRSTAPPSPSGARSIALLENGQQDDGSRWSCPSVSGAPLRRRRGGAACGGLTPRPLQSYASLPEQLDVIGLGRARERADEAEVRERRLRHALDAGRVRGFAARVRVVGEAADLDRVLRACGSRRCRSGAGAAPCPSCSGARPASAPRRRCSSCRGPGRSRIRLRASR